MRLGVLLLEPRLEDPLEIRLGAAVGDRGLRPVHLDDGIVDACGVQRGHDVLHGHDERAGRAGRDRGRTAYVDHVPGVGKDLGRPGHVNAAEHDPGVGWCGKDAEGGAGSRVEGDALHDSRAFDGILFRHGFFSKSHG